MQLPEGVVEFGNIGDSLKDEDYKWEQIKEEQIKEEDYEWHKL